MDVTQAIERAYTIGTTAIPGIRITRAEFESFARERLDAVDSWGSTDDRAVDLCLVAACVRQDPRAIAEFLARFGDRMPKYLGRLGANRDLVADVRQIVVTRSIMGDPGKPPALNAYRGAGSLEGWVRATAVREALALARENQRYATQVDGEPSMERALPWMDREVSLVKQIYCEPVSRAFSTGCAELDADDRALLRLHYSQGVTAERLATMYGLSRATVTRRMSDARERLLRRVKAALRTEIGVADRDFHSLVMMVNSQIDLRLSMVLKEPKSPPR